MESISLLNLGFFAKLATIVDILPKLIYFLYACIASAVDALQALVRKLAGLDVYYQSTTGEAVTNTDPLTEFVYGILGFGDSAPLYEALNTVFWSFAIFGLIILVVATMVAIIKSHYSEDSAGTSPWKYIYQSGKAIFTFAIIPLVVIIGLQITAFVLRTLDNITAGAGSAEELYSMFGRSVVEDRFEPVIMSGTEEYDSEGNVIGGEETYAYYDFFGAGAGANSTTFSGMLFKAAAHSSSRVRTGGYNLDILTKFFTAGGEAILGNDASDIPDNGDEEERLEYIAEQIDYLFANNIHLSTDYSYWQVVYEANDVAPVWSVTDITGYGKSVVGSFSKYDVSFVWIFYNLWTFNYIIGFVGVFVTFGIMISIILGLMSRLIKGAAMFLVYPALLGLAPLDNFNAFKSWGKNFMQQLMMAFGSILGINLLLLILPYVQSINFFNIGVIDVMIQLVMLVSGLLMAQDFISMVNGFVGGADAGTDGGKLKGAIGGKLKAGIRPAAAIAGTGVRVGVGAAKVGIAAGKALHYKIHRNSAARRANKEVSKRKDLMTNRNNITNSMNALRRKAEDNHKEDLNSYEAKRKEKYLKKGWSEEDATNKAKADRKKKLDDYAAKDSQYGPNKGYSEFADLQEALVKSDKKMNKSKQKEAKIADKYGLAMQTKEVEGKDGQTRKVNTGYVRTETTDKNYSDKKKNIGTEGADIGKSIADGFIKTIKGVGNLFGIDKTIKSAKETLGESLSSKGGVFADIKKKQDEDKDKEAAKAKEKTSASNESNQTTYLQDIANSMKTFVKNSQDLKSSSQATLNAIKGLSGNLKAFTNKSNNTTKTDDSSKDNGK